MGVETAAAAARSEGGGSLLSSSTVNDDTISQKLQYLRSKQNSYSTFLLVAFLTSARGLKNEAGCSDRDFALCQ